MKELIVKLRNQTGASLVDVKRVLDETGGDYDKALSVLKAKGLSKAEKMTGRETNEGAIGHYVHPNGKLGAFAVLACETDFVARNAVFTALAADIAMHAAATQPENVEALLAEEFVKRDGVTIADLIAEAVAKLGENIVLKNFTIAKV